MPPPNTQTLFLRFEPASPAGKKGLFSPNSMANPSGVWIDQNNHPSQNDHLTVKLADQAAVSIQIVTALPAGWQYIDLPPGAGGTCLRITTVVFRNHASDATHDSPFASGGRVAMVFDQSFAVAQLVNGSANLPLGVTQLSSQVPQGLDRYISAIVVSLNVQDPGGVQIPLTASRDPQMDVHL